jgi:hypothetical protein
MITVITVECAWYVHGAVVTQAQRETLVTDKPKMRQRKIKLWTWVSCEHGEQDIRVCWHCYQQAILAADKAAREPLENALARLREVAEYGRCSLDSGAYAAWGDDLCLGLIRALDEEGGEDG